MELFCKNFIEKGFTRWFKKVDLIYKVVKNKSVTYLFNTIIFNNRKGGTGN